MQFLMCLSNLCAILWFATCCQLSNAERTFLNKLRNSEFLISTDSATIHHKHREHRDLSIPAEKAKYEHRKDMMKLQRSSPELTHRVVFSIQQRNLDRLEEILIDISDPRSVNYGQHLSNEEVHELTGNPQATAHLLSYLGTAQQTFNAPCTVIKQSPQGEYVTVEASLKFWEQMFRTEFHEFASVQDPTLRFHRALQYFMPAELNSHVSTVFNTVQMPDLKSALRKRQRKSKRRPVSPFISTTTTTTSSPATTTTTSSPATTTTTTTTTTAAHTDTVTPSATVELLHYVTPATLNRVYSIDSNDGHNLGSQAVYETIEQAFSPSDLTKFQKQFNLPVQAIANDIGGHMSNEACVSDNANNCIEANLDVQYLMAVAYNVPTTYYYWDGEDFLLEWIQEVASMDAPPLVFSISYGVDEYELPDSYGPEFDTVAMKLGVRGVTILASSGDDGAVSPSAAVNSMMCGYSPSFPATSPYVTAVGGTMGPESHTAEVVCQSDKRGVITSGGGFSTMYSTPAWQREQIQSYLSTIGSGSTGKGGLPGRGAPLAGFNTGGRGYPDVSALAFNYIVAVNNNFTAVSGTSASSPVLAGMVSLVNSARIAAGKSPLGWINPALYQLYDTFAIDITEGTNNCAAGGLICCGHGYSALPGWDPVTGLGSVKFDAFKSAFLALGDHSLSPTTAPTAIPNTPTTTPTIGTTSSPTVTPTAYPTVSKGFMYLQEYSSTECEGDVTTVSGVPVGVCMVEYNAQNRAVGSIKYTCDSVHATVSVYSSTTCQESKLLQREHYGLGCAVSVLDSYAEDAVAYSTSLSCSSGGDIPLPEGSAVLTYAMQSSYDSTSCTTATLSEYAFYLNNHCFTVSDADGDFSYQFVYPSVYQYSVAGCVRRAQVSVLSEQCAAVDSTGDTTDVLREQWSSVTTTPTTTPTMLPTAVAQPVDAIVTISVDQALQGISAASFKAGGQVSETVFKHAVAKTMSTVKSTDVKIVSVTDDLGTSGDTSSGNKGVKPDSAYINVCVVSYTITLSTLEGGYASADTAYILTITQLYSAVQNGQFDSYVHQYAQFYHSTTLVGVFTPDSTDAISTTFTSAPPTNSSHTSSNAVTIAIVVLVLAFVVVVAVYVYARHKSLCVRTESRYAHLETDSAHGSVHNATHSNTNSAGGAVGTSLSRMAAKSILGRALMKDKTPPAPSAPTFTIESEEELGDGDEETGKEIESSGSQENGKYSQDTAGVELSTYNPISREAQESLSV